MSGTRRAQRNRKRKKQRQVRAHQKCKPARGIEIAAAHIAEYLFGRELGKTLIHAQYAKGCLEQINE